MEPTLKEKAESRVEALKAILATADAKLEEAHKAFKLQQGIAYSVAARLKDAERLAQSFGPGTQETLTGQASTDLALAQAKSNVAEFGFEKSLVTEGNKLLENEQRAEWRADWTKCPHPEVSEPYVRSSDNSVYVTCRVCGAHQTPPGAPWHRT